MFLHQTYLALGSRMLVAISKYLKPLHEVDVYTLQHRAYLKTLFDEGKILISGRQNPPIGGVIIAKIASKEAFEKLLKNDPFTQAGVAEYTIIEFNPTLYDPKILSLLEPFC